MDIFTSKRQANLQRRRYERRRNPCPGRTSNDTRKIRNTLRKLRAHLIHTMALTGNKELPWLPSKYVLTDRDDRAIVDWRAITERFGGYETDDSGLILSMHDKSIKATNRIEAVTVYANERAHYMIRKSVHSPLPCEEWGTLPLNIDLWRLIAPTLIYTRVLWQWVHAVRDYAAMNDLHYSYTVGWSLAPCRPPFDKSKKHVIYMGEKYDGEPDEWTGNIICKQITDGFSLQTIGRDG